MNHAQMAQMTYGFVCKAAITGADGEAVSECKQWLTAIGSGQLRIAEMGQEISDPEPVDPDAPLTDPTKHNGENAPPDGPEGDAAPG